jgi:hypothetical protein
MNISHGFVYEHKKLGAVVAIGHRDKSTFSPDRSIVRVVKLDDFRTAPYVEISAKQGGRIEAEVHEVEADSLRPRNAGSTMSVEEFMRQHHRAGWKPKPLPKPRKLSEEKFAALMREHGATGLQVQR